jgi:hypothetical protein
LYFEFAFEIIVNPHVTLTNSPFLTNTAGVDRSPIIISTCRFPNTVGVVLDVIKKAASYFTYSNIGLPLEPRKGNTFNQQETRKGKKQILTGRKVLETGK